MAVGDTAEAMRAFMSAGGWSFPVVLASDELAMSYGIRVIPTLVVIDSSGQIVKTIKGVKTSSELADIVKDISR